MRLARFGLYEDASRAIAIGAPYLNYNIRNLGN